MTGFRRSICSKMCASDLGLHFLGGEGQTDLNNCDFCSGCGMRTRGGPGVPCIAHDLSEDTDGTECPDHDARAVELYEQVLRLIAQLKGEITDEQAAAAWKLLEDRVDYDPRRLAIRAIQWPKVPKGFDIV